MDRRIDTAVALAFAILGLVVIWAATGIREGMMRDPVGPRMAFYLCGGTLLAGGLWVAGGHLLRWGRQRGHIIRNEGTGDEPEAPASALRAWALVGLALLYVIAFKPFGYLLATPLFILAALALMGERRWLVAIAVALIFTAATWSIFALILDVRIPVGPLTPWFRTLGIVRL